MSYKLKLSPLFVIEFIFSLLFIIFFGFGNFLIFILASMIFGVVLLGIFWKNMLEFQILGFKNMLTQFSFVIAGFLLVFPGVLTSFIGFLIFLFGIFLKIATKTKYTHRQNRNSSEEIIDVEIIEDEK
ncbi:integral memnbrane protein [Campylobacter sp. LH-2024]|uniref:integral memnbrane protein n=1 Tax=Campylobacter TaxID=194 RepID=UPI0019052D27|nr:integral memnbrane protein [Campylobacter sp. 2018MI35]MBZ7929991.1 integral memnbrane protein [Campylobacter sp. W0067]MBZ7932519.1 integral memnbrane protein [Campylobacter sp. RM10543]MBZ7934054.1 integral memnbrane protein [Campylobacter sp. W0065]MBZ7942321.1 integral memnbrane protein [Campylobacter sp. W0045]MBZ7943340.1 integral memnbrane protein [Campylobacter sp. RM13744]MBZ7946335.1 integral memnbrane protein [Campylobacter sp. RM10536]MBZ7948129.1 integral memnbrane protein [C